MGGIINSFTHLLIYRKKSNELANMILGKVCGQIYSTINHPFYDKKRLLVIDKLSLEGKPTGDYLIAIDSVGAGFDETVLVIDEGNSARQVVEDPEAPLRSIVVGIVDQKASGLS